MTEGGVDAVLRQQLDLAQEEIEKYKNLEVEQQQKRAEEKSRKRHVETNTPEMDITMIKELTAQIKNKDIDLDLAKDALYRLVFTHQTTISKKWCLNSKVRAWLAIVRRLM